MSQASALERKGKRMSTEGRVKPWSWMEDAESSVESLAACAIRSLFFRMRRRILCKSMVEYYERVGESTPYFKT